MSLSFIGLFYYIIFYYPWFLNLFKTFEDKWLKYCIITHCAPLNIPVSFAQIKDALEWLQIWYWNCGGTRLNSAWTLDWSQAAHVVYGAGFPISCGWPDSTSPDLSGLIRADKARINLQQANHRCLDYKSMKWYAIIQVYLFVNRTRRMILSPGYSS